MKFAFLGTSEFAAAILEKLVSDFYYPELVITQPDKPAGRKKLAQSPPVKAICDHHRLLCRQPDKIIEIKDELALLDLDLLLVAAYGQILPKAILDIPKIAAVNVHASLLPKHRGASPIHAAILSGDEETGITIMQMDEEMDHGGIYYKKAIDISATDTFQSLQSKLAALGSDITAKVLPDITKGKLIAKPQKHDEATYTKLITKKDALIDWNNSAEQIDRQARAYYPWPIAWTQLTTGERLKIYRAAPVKTAKEHKPGTIFFEKNIPFIACKKGALRLNLVQVEGKRQITAEEFSRGYRRLEGTICL